MYRNEHKDASSESSEKKASEPQQNKQAETPKLAESKPELKEKTAEASKVHEATTDAKTASYEAFNTAILNDPKADYVKSSLDSGELLQRDSIMDTVAHKKELEAKKQQEIQDKQKEEASKQHQQLDDKQKAEDKKKREEAKKQIKKHQNESFMFQVGKGLHNIMSSLFGLK